MSIGIIREERLTANNVLVCEGTYFQNEVNDIVDRMKAVIAECKAEKTGGIISATLGIYQNTNPLEVDLVIMIPINKEITVDGEFYFLKEFVIEKAIKVRHIGNPSTLSNALLELESYINDRSLTPTTTNYNVAVREATSSADINDMIIDIYIGIE